MTPLIAIKERQSTYSIMPRGFKRRILWPTRDSEEDAKFIASYAEAQSKIRVGSTCREIPRGKIINIDLKVILVALALVANRAKSRELGYFDQEVNRDSLTSPP